MAFERRRPFGRLMEPVLTTEARVCLGCLGHRFEFFFVRIRCVLLVARRNGLDSNNDRLRGPPMMLLFVQFGERLLVKIIRLKRGDSEVQGRRR